MRYDTKEYFQGASGMIGETKAKNRPGRRPKVAGDLKNSSLTFRTRGGMREKLEASARARDLSISEEVERRIMLSFDLASSPANEYVIRSVSDALHIVEKLRGQTWNESPITALMCFSAISGAAGAVIANHNVSSIDGDIKEKADKAGAVHGVRAAMLNAGVPVEKILEIGKEELDEYIFALARRDALAEALRGQAEAPLHDAKKAPEGASLVKS